MLEIKVFHARPLELVAEFHEWSKSMHDKKKPFQIVSATQSMSFFSVDGEPFIDLIIIFVHLSNLTLNK